MKTHQINNDLADLDERELCLITAGESGWYYIAYAVGAIVRGAYSFLQGFQDSERTMGGLK